MAADVAAMMQRCTELETEAKRLRAENEWLRRAELEREQLNLELVRHQATIEKLTQAAFLKTQQTLEQNARMWTTMSAMGAPDAWRPGAAPAAAAARAALGGDVNANDSKLKKLTSHLTHGDVADAVSTAQRGEAAQGRAFVLPDFLGDMTDYGLAELGPDDAAARASPSPSPALAAHAAPTVLPPALAVDEFPVDASCDLYGALVSGALDAKDKDLDMAHMSSFSASTCNILQSMLASNGHDLLQSTKEVDQGHDPFESAAAACALDDDDRRKNGDGRSWPLRKSAAPKKAAARSDTRGPRLRGRRRGDTDRPAAALVTPPPASPAAPRAAGARAALCDPSLPPAVAQAPFGGTPAAFMRQMFTQQQVTMMMAQQPPAPGAAQTTRPFSLPFCDRPPPPLPTTLQPSPRRSEPKSEPNAAELNQEMFKMCVDALMRILRPRL
ncbi:hypothetical protein M885DRAFT_107908 [Pelagophyceae sp. CCMP2097]|nr:hypothetical protein M885DRAFT_107908 [Pelagophyceae sp. CCMP2097]